MSISVPNFPADSSFHRDMPACAAASRAQCDRRSDNGRGAANMFQHTQRMAILDRVHWTRPRAEEPADDRLCDPGAVCADQTATRSMTDVKPFLRYWVGTHNRITEFASH